MYFYFVNNDINNITMNGVIGEKGKKDKNESKYP